MTKRSNQQDDPRLVAIRASIEPVLAVHAVALCDLGWFQEPGGRTLRLTIERPLPMSDAGVPEPWEPARGFGVNLDDCAAVSRDVSTVLDELEVADPTALPAEYLLEVSSPGLDRPLRGATDFVRFRGALAKVKLAKPASDGQRVLRGVIVEASADHVAMTVDGKRFEVPLADVESANLVFELAAEPKNQRGAPKKGGAASGAAADSKNDTTVPLPGGAKGSIRRAG